MSKSSRSSSERSDVYGLPLRSDVYGGSLGVIVDLYENEVLVREVRCGSNVIVGQ